MRLIPDAIYATSEPTINRGEKIVFQCLSQLTQCDTWICIHSCNHIGNHKQSSFELDFLIISPRGFLGIEVKGGPVRCKDGIYYVGGAHGYKKNKSPYAQASDAMDAIRTGYLAQRFSNQLNKHLFAKAAILVENSRPDHFASADMPADAIIYKEELSNPESFLRALNRAYDFAETNLRKTESLSQAQIKKVAKAMRPDFDVSFASTSAIDSELRRQQAFTEDQYATLDILVFLSRAVIDGGAGTGKRLSCWSASLRLRLIADIQSSRSQSQSCLLIVSS